MSAKDDVRIWARAAAKGVDALLASQGIVAGLADWLDPDATILIYRAMPGEADLAGLEHSGRILVTRTPKTGPLTVHSAESEYERHPFGYEQPVEGALEVDPTEIDIALVPALTFARNGARLGHGKGYYDRLLARVRPDCLRVGVVFDELIVDALPTESHDISMTHLATQSGVRQIR